MCVCADVYMHIYNNNMDKHKLLSECAYVIIVFAQITIEPTFTTLDIREVFPEDSGTYTVIIRNIGGETRTSCLVTIEGIYSTGGEELHEPMKPKFLQHLQNKEVQEGSRARLDCVIVGYPEPEVCRILPVFLPRTERMQVSSLYKYTHTHLPCI